MIMGWTCTRGPRGRFVGAKCTRPIYMVRACSVIFLFFFTVIDIVVDDIWYTGPIRGGRGRGQLMLMRVY